MKNSFLPLRRQGLSICFALILSLCLPLSSCAKKQSKGSSKIYEIGQEITAQKADNTRPWVVTADGYEDGGYSIAQFNVNSDEIKKLNEEIYNEFANANGERRLKLSYTVGQKGALCSVLFASVYEGRRIDYKAYSVDLSNAKPAESIAVAAFYKYSEKKYTEALKAAVTAEFLKEYGSFKDKTAGYDEALNKSTDEKYLKSAVPFVNEDGKLCAVITILGMDGEEHSATALLEELA